MRVKNFDYNLPEGLIAQRPCERRDESRLLVLNRKDGKIIHSRFREILNYLNEGDCLVLNNSKVIPARLIGKKEITGGKAEFLLIKRNEGDIWETMVRPGKKLKPGDSVIFGNNFSAKIIDYGPQGTRTVKFSYEGIFMNRLEEFGSVPLPPYIDRAENQEDKERYQTVYCKEEGSVAAPTAGLHFTEELLKKAEERGIRLAYVTLHVGIGTFRPVKAEKVEDHIMHFEDYYIDSKDADIINETKKKGGRVICVGTTSTRTLESAAQKNEHTGRYEVLPGENSTGIFIYPGYPFKMTDAQITNFHLPKSTLLMLISAFYSREKVLEAYKEAIDNEYRFFSYGDAMLIL